LPREAAAANGISVNVRFVPESNQDRPATQYVAMA
jgi:hypothetical protein